MEYNSKELNEPRNVSEITYYNLRMSLGLIALTLPLIVIVIDLLLPGWITATEQDGKSGLHINTSISAYYFSDARNYLIGALSGIGIFLIAYSGSDWQDNWLCFLAGIGGLLVGFFPTSMADGAILMPWVENLYLSTDYKEYLSRSNGYEVVIGLVHVVGAVLLFGSIGILSYCYFTKARPADDVDRPKLRRNRIYRNCGRAIGVAILVIAVGFACNLVGLEVVDQKMTGFGVVFFAETVAVLAFAAAWLVASKRFGVLGGKQAAATSTRQAEFNNENSQPCWFCRSVERALQIARSILDPVLRLFR